MCRIEPYTEGACQVVPLDGSDLSYAWRDNGQSNRCHEITTDAVEDATVTLPLTDGQQVWTRDGKLATVSGGSTSGVVVMQDGTRRDYARSVYRRSGTNYQTSTKLTSPQDAVADA